MPRQLINIEGVDRSFGPVDVLLDINLLVQDGDRIGIVGHNGAGKTTLLNTISEQSQDVGEIEFAPGIRIAYLTQIRDLEADSTIEEELSRKGRQFQELEHEIAKIEAQMIEPEFYDGDWESVMERYSGLQQTLGASGGGNVANIAKATLTRLGLDKHPMDMKVANSPVEKKPNLLLPDNWSDFLESTSCSWTSQPITWTSKPPNGSKLSSKNSKALNSSYLTTDTSSTKCALELSKSTISVLGHGREITVNFCVKR